MGGRIALLIGTGNFGVDALSQLHAPATDVRELAAVLRDPYAGGFDPVIELVDASTQQVGREIAHTLDRCRRDDMVLLYFSGHALIDEEGQLHLAMRDSEPDLLSPTSISAAFVAAEFDRSRSRRQLVILDCRTGSGFAHGAQPELPPAQPPDARQLASAFHAEGHPRVILAGCKHPDAVDRRSRPSWPVRPGSSFTQSLISGLRGAADGDGDGRISIDQLYEYAAAQHSERPGEQPVARAGNAIGSQLIANAVPRSSAPPRISTAPPGPKPGSLISDRYRILSVLAERGFGVVCSALDERNGRHVSIKCLRPPQSNESGTLARFLREAEVVGAIDHPGLPAIYDVGFERSTAFIVMEPVAGESLAALLRRQRRLSIRETLEIVMQAAAAIGAAHGQRVVHRDLNPEHIFVGRAPDGTVAQIKVLGFGASALLDDKDLARTGGLIGSPHYMAPEQVLGGAPPDVRVDVYAFGVILYEALTGQRPFEAENHGALLFKISSETPVPPSQWVPELPAALESIVQKAMAADRTRRFADVENLRLALYQSGLEHGWIRASAPPPLPPPLPLQPPFVPKINTPLVFDRPPSSTLAPQSRRWPLALGLGAAVVAAGAAWFLSASNARLPGTTTATPVVQPRPAPEPVPALPPTAAKTPEPQPAPAPAAEPQVATAPAPAPEPNPPPAAAEPPALENAAQAEPAVEPWRARQLARAAERRSAREQKAREREQKAQERAAAAAAAAEARAQEREKKAQERAAAAAAAAEAEAQQREQKAQQREQRAQERAAAAAAAAEARAEAAAEMAAIRAATRAANKVRAVEQDPAATKPQLKVSAVPDELPELKVSPQPPAAAPPAPSRAGPKPGPPPAPRE